MKFLSIILSIVSMLVGCMSCTPSPENVLQADEPLLIYPDYKDVSIPVNIAPMNFLLRNEGVEALYVIVRAEKDSLEYKTRGNKVKFPMAKWKKLLESARGETLTVEVIARQRKGWKRFSNFNWQVMPDSIDPYITYRLIEPGYEVWNALQLVERNITNFEERVIADNKLCEERCMNCHIHGNNSGDLSLFHLRGKNGGTILNRNGELRLLDLKNNRMVSAAVYGDIHPGGRYGVFSSNIIIPSFHSYGNRRLEVFDTVSDLAIADFDKNEMLISPLTSDSTVLETFPTFSADGKYVYYCAAPNLPVPDSIREVRYSICRIGFDSRKGEWGSKVDTLWNAEEKQASVCLLKASPDGKYLLYTVADYGTFPIWHRETDLQMMDLETGRIDTLKMVNSNRSETYHSWSSNSRWFVFASKRGDGQYGRVYVAYIDKNGEVFKPFVIPQSDPENDDLNLKSYNIPDISATPVPFDAKKIQRFYRQHMPEQFK
ncbi:hypothetical protein [uncultured Bacteroides sp.]|uniref:TolB family protein n=1 Tax=uncultured Bacteroides sp. TaxID=162156 RepID=UPI00260CA028|nr:hypothetical protein [uncultured Bacteroides sp.]